MTTPTPPDAVQVPPLPVVAYINHKACMPPTFDIAATAGTLHSEPLCKVSDAQAYAAQCTAPLEAKLAAADTKLFHLFEAACAVLTNNDHAFSGGMASYQKGSQTWEVYEELRAALTPKEQS